MRQMVLLNPQASLPFPGYRVQTTIEAGGAVFTVYKDEMPLVLCVLAINPDDASCWNGIEDMYLKSKLPTNVQIDWALSEKPASTPWLAVVLLDPQHDPQAEHWHWPRRFRALHGVAPN
jgi:hypothetical protein